MRTFERSTSKNEEKLVALARVCSMRSRSSAAGVVALGFALGLWVLSAGGNYPKPARLAPAIDSSHFSIRKQNTSRARLAETYGKLPLRFEPNVGQTSGQVQYFSRGRGYTVFLTREEVVLALERTNQESNVNRQPPANRIPDRAVLRMKLVNCSPAARVTGLDELPGKSNYFIGGD